MSQDKYAILREAGLAVTVVNNTPGEYSCVGTTQSFVFADAVLAWLVAAPVIYSHRSHPTIETWHYDTIVDASQGAIHSAKLVCIAPIRRDTERSLIQELLDINDNDDRRFPLNWVERARKVVGK